MPQTLTASVRDELDRLGGAPAGSAGIGDLVAAWPAAVGTTIARNAWPARVTGDGTLVVHTASSAWAFELTQLEQAVREKLGDLAPLALRFVVGPIPEPSSNSAEVVSESRRSIPNPSPDQLRRALALAGPIEDPELRETVARAAAAALARAGSGPATTDPSGRLKKE